MRLTRNTTAIRKHEQAIEKANLIVSHSDTALELHYLFKVEINQHLLPGEIDQTEAFIETVQRVMRQQRNAEVHYTMIFRDRMAPFHENDYREFRELERDHMCKMFPAKDVAGINEALVKGVGILLDHYRPILRIYNRLS